MLHCSREWSLSDILTCCIIFHMGTSSTGSRYEILCGRYNAWQEDTMALKLPTLLDGEGLRDGHSCENESRLYIRSKS